MPELPEVETVMHGLQPKLVGRRFQRVELMRADLRFPFPDGFQEALEGAEVLKLERRSKYILWHVQKPEHTPGVVLTHLGMSGRFDWYQIPPTGYKKHDHVLWFLDDGSVLVYHDPRRFGIIDYVECSQLAAHKLLCNLGPEPLTAAFNKAYAVQKLARRAQAIKVVLMDAAFVVGVGNIYASEACFLAGIHPETPARDLAPLKVAALVKAMKQVLKAAIDSGGSSLRDFWHVDGGGGYFQHQFNVYGRKGKLCLACRAAIEQMTQAGRSSFFCPSCQAK